MQAGLWLCPGILILMSSWLYVGQMNVVSLGRHWAITHSLSGSLVFLALAMITVKQLTLMYATNFSEMVAK